MTEPYSETEKLKWEIEKLRAEVGEIKRPWFRNPTFWVAVVAALGALGGVIVQSVKSGHEYNLAEIKSERAALATERAERLQGQYREQNGKLQLENVLLAKQQAQLQEQRKQLLGEIAQAEWQFNEIRTQLQSESGKTKLAVRTEEAVGNLQAIKEAVGEHGSPLPAFAVIGSFQSIQRAESFAANVFPREATYAVEVFQREPRRYAVTLGGYLTYDEAAKRVERARQVGIDDAYVRLAKDWGKPVSKFPKS